MTSEQSLFIMKKTRRLLKAGTPISLLMFDCGNSLRWKNSHSGEFAVQISTKRDESINPDTVVRCHTGNCCEQGSSWLRHRMTDWFLSLEQESWALCLQGLTANLCHTDLVWASRKGLVRCLSLLEKGCAHYVTNKPFLYVWWVLVVLWQVFQYDYLLAVDAEDIFLWVFFFNLSFTNVSTALLRIFHHKILNTQIPFSFAGYARRKPIVGRI